MRPKLLIRQRDALASREAQKRESLLLAGSKQSPKPRCRNQAVQQARGANRALIELAPVIFSELLVETEFTQRSTLSELGATSLLPTQLRVKNKKKASLNQKTLDMNRAIRILTVHEMKRFKFGASIVPVPRFEYGWAVGLAPGKRFRTGFRKS